MNDCSGRCQPRASTPSATATRHDARRMARSALHRAKLLNGHFRAPLYCHARLTNHQRGSTETMLPRTPCLTPTEPPSLHIHTTAMLCRSCIYIAQLIIPHVAPSSIGEQHGRPHCSPTQLSTAIELWSTTFRSEQEHLPLWSTQWPGSRVVFGRCWSTQWPGSRVVFGRCWWT
jgi:hypothetical protein